MSYPQYVPTHIARSTFGVYDNTLRNWADRGWIDVLRTPGGQRLYNVQKFIADNSQEGASPVDITKKCVCYCRVSSAGQRDDLERQKSYMRSRYPDHELIADIGSGLNFKRKGLQTLLEYCFKNLVTEVVVAHRDRLCRFGFDLLQWILSKHGARLVVLDQGNESPEDELASDLISIVHVFSCKINGKRKYKRKEQGQPEREQKDQDQEEGEGDAKTIRTWFSHSRKTYNLALAALKRGAFKPSDEYRLRWRFVTDKQLGRRLSYLKSTPSKIRAGAVAELCAAYKANFTVFKKKPEHRFSLKFKTRKDEQSLSLQKDSFVKPGSKDKCKLFFPQSIQDAIRTSPILPPEFWTSIPSDCRLTMNKAGEMYIQVPVPAPNLALPSESPERIISLDPGVRTFLTGYSPATQERGPKIVEVGSGDMSRIMRLCYHMDSLISKKDKAKNCTSRRKIQRRIDKLRLKIKRLRTDCHHRTAHYLTTNYDSVLLPTFETSQMVCRKGRKIRSKTVREMQSWSHYAFRQRLITKAAERGTHLIEVTEEYTSKTCCACGTIKWNLGGSKSFRCSSKACGLQIDRDWNGAINILVKYITETFLKALNRTATFIGSGPCKLSLPTGFPS